MLVSLSYVNERDRFKYGNFILIKFYYLTNSNTNLKSWSA